MIVIHHNPDCGTSRNVLAIIEASGEAYKQIASYPVAESPTWAPPVLLKNQLLIKSLNQLTLWSLKGNG